MDDTVKRQRKRASRQLSAGDVVHQDSIKKADEYGIAMVFGERHFKH
jgi:AICAR transformylase/IMP cyclohydrolase PurH